MNPPVTFDQILPVVRQALDEQAAEIRALGSLVINRDLWGKVRLLAPPNANASAVGTLEKLARRLSHDLGAHAYPPESMILTPENLPGPIPVDASFPLPGFANVRVVDRQTAGLGWSTVAAGENTHPRRLVAYSIKGGVGRSTAMAAYAWWLARRGQRVLVVDLDLESPGLSTTLLADDRQPVYGVTDWLVEALVGQEDTIFTDLVGRSDLARDLPGDILVVPAHGRAPGEYIAKLGRAFLPLRAAADESPESTPWARRLLRLLGQLEEQHKPDVVLLDSRAGIDDTACAIVTDLGAQILLFALDARQSWNDYRILFDHWLRTGVVQVIRERLKLVAALVPELDPAAYLDQFRERAWDLFCETLYDELPPDTPAAEGWSFDLEDPTAPHAPLPIRWHRSFAARESLDAIDAQNVEAVYGMFFDGLDALLGVA